MKKFILFLSLILSFLVATLGCTSKKVVSAEQTAKALYNLYVLSDGEEGKNIGITEEEINEVYELQKTKTIESIKSNFTTLGVEITDNELEKIYTLQRDAFKKLTCKISIESESEETTTVKLSTNYINITEVDTKSANDAIAEATENGETSISAISKIYIKNLIENLKSIEPSTENLEATFEFTKQKLEVDNKEVTVWAPDDFMSFGVKLGTMIVGVSN